jgi:hypothetical protein
MMNQDNSWPSTRGIAILVVGVLLGFITAGPNIMMSDSGTPEAMRTAYVGMIASLLFVVGGVVGFFANYGWWILLPGLLMQLLVFQTISQISRRSTHHPTVPVGEEFKD